jgi:hypothetical protein
VAEQQRPNMAVLLLAPALWSLQTLTHLRGMIHMLGDLDADRPGRKSGDFLIIIPSMLMCFGRNLIAPSWCVWKCFERRADRLLSCGRPDRPISTTWRTEQTEDQHLIKNRNDNFKPDILRHPICMVSSGLRLVVAPKWTFVLGPETSLGIPAVCVLAAAALSCKLDWRWRGRY